MYKGGGLLATGSSSCIVKPNISCKNGKYKKKDDKKISKIVFGRKSEEYTNREKNIDDIIKKIPGYNNWSLVFDELCKPPPFNEAKKMDKGLYDCIGDPSVEGSSIKLKGTKNTKKRELFDKHSIMLVGDYGGETLESYFENQFDESKENIKIIEKKFLDIMEKLDELFLGLVELKRNGISHLDVKPNNIVLEKNCNDFKFIDFGLSGKYSNVKHFKKRAVNEENTSRLYLWYPPEFLFSQTADKKLVSMKQYLEKHDFIDFRNNADTYKSIYKLFNRDAKLSLMNIFNNYLDSVWVPDFNSIITKLDVYSLGMLIPILFYNNDLLERIGESEMLKSFFSLFDLMTVPLYIFRIDIENAYILYKGLMEKYSKRSNKSQKKSNKALKKSKKKSKNKSKKNKSKKLSKKK
uniref:Protein kinase domain-containing protein n=1 Tax=viral metagenome TaxID=1070528 RepID=A0A6C0C858_9ZZZZ